MSAGQAGERVLYEPDEVPPFLVSLVHGFQSVMGRLAGMAATTAIIVHATGRSRAGWNEASANRLRAAGEEAVSSLLSANHGQAGRDGRSLTVGARRIAGKVELEFVAASWEASPEDGLAYLAEEPEMEDDGELSFRLLRHYASSVRHRKYHDLDVVTVEVDGSPGPAEP